MLYLTFEGWNLRRFVRISNRFVYLLAIGFSWITSQPQKFNYYTKVYRAINIPIQQNTLENQFTKKSKWKI